MSAHVPTLLTTIGILFPYALLLGCVGYMLFRRGALSSATRNYADAFILAFTCFLLCMILRIVIERVGAAQGLLSFKTVMGEGGVPRSAKIAYALISFVPALGIAGFIVAIAFAYQRREGRPVPSGFFASVLTFTLLHLVFTLLSASLFVGAEFFQTLSLDEGEAYTFVFLIMGGTRFFLVIACVILAVASFRLGARVGERVYTAGGVFFIIAAFLPPFSSKSRLLIPNVGDDVGVYMMFILSDVVTGCCYLAFAAFICYDVFRAKKDRA